MRLKVLTTFLPGYCIAANVAGEMAKVENLLPGTASLHDYQLSPADLRKISNADLIVINGLGMETFLSKVMQNAPGTKGKIVVLSAGLESELISGDERPHNRKGDHDHTFDPHIWMDPVLAARCATNLAQALAKADPRNAAAYQRNATVLAGRLQKLNEEIAAMLAPVKDKPLVTYHNAFRYFVRRYGLQLAGVVERAPEITPSPKEMGELYQTIRGKKVKALFTEPGATPRLAQQIARDTRIKLAELDPLETGKLEPRGYEDGLRRNAETLLKTLRE